MQCERKKVYIIDDVTGKPKIEQVYTIAQMGNDFVRVCKFAYPKTIQEWSHCKLIHSSQIFDERELAERYIIIKAKRLLAEAKEFYEIVKKQYGY